MLSRRTFLARAAAVVVVVVAGVVVGVALARMAQDDEAPSTPPPQTTPAPAATHREAARAVLEQHCGLCHLPQHDDGGYRVVGGLATHIFDLRTPDWSSTLSDAQLDEAVRKLVNDGASDANVALLERFVADELVWRDAHPSLYSRELRERPLFGDAAP